MNADKTRYWFRAKRYGLGWGLPLAWQGWLFLMLWILTVSAGMFYIAVDKPLRWAFIVAMVTLLFAICYWKGDPRGRRWNSGDGN